MTDEQLRRLRILASDGGLYGLTHGDIAAIQAALDEIKRLRDELAKDGQ